VIVGIFAPLAATSRFNVSAFHISLEKYLESDRIKTARGVEKPGPAFHSLLQETFLV
jgi:hypothetical protein